MAQTGLRTARTFDFTKPELAALRDLVRGAFDHDGVAFGDEDWEHALGGTHVVLHLAGEPIAHASVVERELHMAGRPLRTGYVEAVATSPRHQNRGHGTAVMREVGNVIRRQFELGALSTGLASFYERLGWRRWAGPTYVRTPSGLERTEDEDDGILYLPTPGSPPIDPTVALSCEWRAGDVW